MKIIYMTKKIYKLHTIILDYLNLPYNSYSLDDIKTAIIQKFNLCINSENKIKCDESHYTKFGKKQCDTIFLDTLGRQLFNRGTIKLSKLLILITENFIDNYIKKPPYYYYEYEQIPIYVSSLY